MAWLGAAMLLTIMLLMAVGLVKDTPKQTATGTVPADGGTVTFEIDKDDPQNPTGNRFTGERFEKALNITLNSVVFRASGQDLTTTGIYIEMTPGLTEPTPRPYCVLPTARTCRAASRVPGSGRCPRLPRCPSDHSPCPACRAARAYATPQHASPPVPRP
ncbi:hypothetical protein [Streptomyces europaeiscabiei]|uniref:hypothetical protein n=1 Tax=Streptomyces europaeiscabiei TaxID=146819 RepID=UPI0029C9B575|nr:hypothetical protein [Streptomyces europaeiscabiei]